MRGDLDHLKWLRSYFMDSFVRYGHRPDFAFAWNVFVTAFGCIVFREKGRDSL